MHGKNDIMFRVDISSPLYTDGRYKNILLSGEIPKQCLDNSTITVEVKYFTIRTTIRFKSAL